jgi:hypothetical protein
MHETIEKAKRPASITFICILGFIGALISAPLVFSPAVQQIGSWYPPYLGFSALVGLTCMVGLWMMKKWAAYTYTGFVILNQFLLLATGLWSIMALVIPGIVVFFILRNISKMT